MRVLSLLVAIVALCATVSPANAGVPSVEKPVNSQMANPVADPIGANSGQLETSGALANDLVIVFERPMRLSILAEALEETSLRPVSFHHIGRTIGGFEVGDVSLQKAVRTYRQAHVASAAGSHDPKVLAVRLKDDLSLTIEQRLTSITGPIDAKRLVPEVSSVAIDRTKSMPIRVVGSVPDAKSPEQGAANMTSTGKQYEWAPDRGSINAYQSTSGQRIVHQTLTWDNAASIAAFEPRNAFEHDLKLYNDSAPGGDDGLHPGCPSPDFWTQRPGQYWTTSYPESSEPYLDTNYLDPCTEMDITIGVFYPGSLQPAIQYETSFVGDAGPSATESEFFMGVSSLYNDCSTFLGQVNEAECPGLVDGYGNDYVGQLMLRCDAFTLPGAYSWIADGAPGTNSCDSGRTEQVSINSNGASANDTMTANDVSSNGRFVTMNGYASNLDVNVSDTNGDRDSFLFDRVTRSTRLISVSTSGSVGNNTTNFGTVSNDGRYVAFASYASNLTSAPQAADTNNNSDIFVRDVYGGTTRRIEADPTTVLKTSGPLGPPTAADFNPKGWSGSPVISDDGRYVAFQSSASNFTSSDVFLCGSSPYTYSCEDVFVHDTITGSTTMASVATGGAPAQGSSSICDMSRSGRYVLFQSDAANLFASDAPGSQDIFVRDLVSGTTSRISSTDMSWCEGSISEDGRYVTFVSSTALLGGPGTYLDVLVSDRDTDGDGVFDESGATSLSSSTGSAASGNSNGPQISGDGRYVVFTSEGSNLVAGDGNTTPDVFRYDVATGTLEFLSVSSDETLSDSASLDPFTSYDGNVTAFKSCASNLAPPTSWYCGVFVRVQDPAA